MNRVWLALSILLIAIVACEGIGESNQTPSPAATTWITFTENRFSVDLPADWEEGTSTDEQVIHTVWFFFGQYFVLLGFLGNHVIRRFVTSSGWLPGFILQEIGRVLGLFQRIFGNRLGLFGFCGRFFG